MIIGLPNTLNVNGEEKKIFTDFRDIYQIFVMYADKEVPEHEKTFAMLNMLYVDELKPNETEEAIKKAVWFLDGGEEHKTELKSPKVMDWAYDYKMIISAVDKNVKTAESCLELPYMHWWTFLNKFSERGECQFDTFVNIRKKLATGKKLEPHEKEILKYNRNQIVIDSDDDDDRGEW